MNKLKLSSMGLLVSIMLLLICATMNVSQAATPELHMGVNITECAGCHKDSDVLPKGHLPVQGMNYKTCTTCHQVDGKMSLEEKMSTAHRHQLQGINCQACHGDTQKPSPVEASTCMGCHNATALAEKTANVQPKNPHDSPHYGKESDCTICHYQHEPTENYCQQCHTFDFKVP